METAAPAEKRHRSNAEWIATLGGAGEEQAAALTELRTSMLRAALFTLRRALRYVGHLESSTLAQIAERTGRSREAVKKIYARALAHFRTEFEGPEADRG